ncbi:MAG: DUF1501 domain-containing protein, partial [Planctomycetes bacterium]|nr:DUF1501 domain-containing protein [Planctomycetota bacterium]
CTLALAGGGLKMGQIVGRSARKNDVPASKPVTTGNLLATVMQTLFDVPQLRVARGIPRQLLRVIENETPIEELF